MRGVKSVYCIFCGGSFGHKTLLFTHLCGHTRERPDFCGTCHKEFLTPTTLERHKLSHQPTIERFSCVFCDKDFASNHYLEYHLLRHIGERAYSCNICDHRSITIPDLKHHMKVHGERNFNCQHCEKSFKSEGDLRTHEKRVHLAAKSFKCSFCDKRFKIKSILVAHEKEIHSVRQAIRCDICLKVCLGRKNLQKHMKIHQKRKINVKKHNCLKCGKGFEYLSVLKKHMETHETPQFECNLCGNLYQTRRLLEVHQRNVHISCENYVECRICEKRFKTYGILIHHMATHTGEALYSCEICKKSFSEKYRLAEHRETHFPSVRERFPCDICEKVFLSKKYLKSHSKLHLNPNKCGCGHCGNSCSRSECLRGTGGCQPKPFSCVFCNKSFTSLKGRNTHISSHINERTHMCKICGREFKRPISLGNHYKSCY